MRAKQLNIKVVLFFLTVIAFTIAGCRIGGGYSSDLNPAANNLGNSTLSGAVLAPSGASASRASLDSSLLAADLSGFVSIAGAEVWIEELPDFPHQITDKDGKYLFQGLPAGSFRVVSAFKKADNTRMKVRSAPVELTSAVETATVPDLGLTPANKVVTGVLRDPKGDFVPAGTVLIIWGEKFTVGEEGKFTSPSLPDNVEMADITVAKPEVAVEQRPIIPVQLFSPEEPTAVEMQVGGATENFKPISGSMSVKINGQPVSSVNIINNTDLVDLSVNLVNLDRNTPGITYEWDAGRGNFSTYPTISDSAVWIAPSTSGMAVISVKVTAPDRGSFKLSLPVVVDVPVKAQKFTLSFDSQSGTTVPAQVVEAEARASEPTAPTRSGFKFAGWYKEAFFTNQWNFAIDKVTAATTLYARWVTEATVTYELAFYTQGGSPVSSQIIESGAKASAPARTTRTGYTFAGWFKETALINEWNFSVDTISSNTILYAKWVAENVVTYRLAFDSTGGSRVTSQIIKSGEKATEPVAPIKTGFELAGWFRDSALLNQWNFNIDSLAADTTLFARWIPATIASFKVTFDSQGGNLITAQTIKSGSKVNEPAMPIRAGYDFVGWYKEAALQNQWNFLTDSISANTSLFAKWVTATVASFRLTFDSQGGSAVSEQTIKTGLPGTQPVPPTRAGYEFAGWYKEVTLQNQWNFLIDSITANTTLFAKWTPVTVPTFRLIFDSMGGNPVTTQLVLSGKKAIEPAAPAKTGFTFAGWYKETGLTNQWNFASDVVTQETTIYAKWISSLPGQYTLNYIAGANGTISGATTQSVAPGANGTAVTAVPATGYAFSSWSDSRTDNPRTDLNLSGNLSVTASFVEMGAKSPGTNKYAYSENAGWINFAPTGGNALVKIGANGYLSGTVWSENLGWIKLAASTATAPYANTTAGNWGVNMAADGKLSGYAWGESCGWINFSANGADAAMNLQTGSMSGSAWGENIGWVKFAGASYGVQFSL